MNIRLFCLPLLFACLLFPRSLHADSPLTSTPFHNAYMDVSIVAYAKEQRTLDKKIAKYLMKSGPALHRKAAVINAMGWDIDGQNNAELFLKFLKKKRKLKVEKDFEKLSGADLFCMGYMMAMDNYFDVTEAFQVLSTAQTKLGDNFTAHFILALVEAQIHLDSDWCKVWQVVRKVERNDSLDRSMREAGVAIVMEYISLYESECK